MNAPHAWRSAQAGASRVSRDRLRSLYWALPVGLKLGLPLLAVAGLIAVLPFLTLPQIRSELEHAYATQTRTLAAVVQAEYADHANDRDRLDRFLRDVKALEPTVVRVRIYRIASGVPVVWASSDPAELASVAPTAGDVLPITSGRSFQVVERIAGAPVLETVQPLLFRGVIDAAAGFYISLEPLEAAADKVRRIALTAAALLVCAVVVVGGLTLNFVVIRPIRRLQRAALRIASGDLTARLTAGADPPARDELASVARAFDIMARAVAEGRAEVKRLSVTDALTGLANRRQFDQQLELEVRRAARLRYPLALLMVDLDGFKSINDTRGHPAGDDALVQVAAALRAAGRDTDTVARYGGDEFALILPGSEPAAALIVGTRIRAAVEALGIVADGPSGWSLGASVGVADLHPQDGPAAAVAAADVALYRAKARGGGVEVAERAAVPA